MSPVHYLEMVCRTLQATMGGHLAVATGLIVLAFIRYAFDIRPEMAMTTDRATFYVAKVFLIVVAALAVIIYLSAVLSPS